MFLFLFTQHFDFFTQSYKETHFSKSNKGRCDGKMFALDFKAEILKKKSLFCNRVFLLISIFSYK